MTEKPHAVRRWVSLVAAIVGLNALLAFENVWPTPAVWWTGAVSVEVAVALLAWLLATRRPSVAWPASPRWLTAIWLVLSFARYADVTAPALLGREINLFWDLRYATDVAAMFAQVATPTRVGSVALATMALVGLLYMFVRWALSRLAIGLGRAGERRALTAVAVAGVALFSAQGTIEGWPRLPRFSRPVTSAILRQASFVAKAMAPRQTPPPPPAALASDLSLVQGADVLLVFLESYGAVSWQRPAFLDRLSESRGRLTAAVAAAGHDVASAYVTSPTFGGSSWFAHISLLSGLEIKDPNANALLMTERRPTMVTTFAGRGYRTVALMPGLWQPWPEGSFYGFHKVYGGPDLAYTGPQFGWWAIPDQFALAKLDALELGRQEGPPVFMFFPTVSTHTPFAPAPPYQPDWPRALTAQPFDEDEVGRRFDQQPDWTNLSPSYADAVAYAHAVLAGFFEQRRPRDFVMVLLGDHQPPALVTGEGASWDVPVHVITRRPLVLERLRAQGLQPGLEPRGESISGMHELLPVLLDGFGDRLPPPTAHARLPTNGSNAASIARSGGRSRAARRQPPVIAESPDDVE